MIWKEQEGAKRWPTSPPGPVEWGVKYKAATIWVGCRDSSDLSGDPGFGRSKEVKGHPQRRRRMQRTLLVWVELEFQGKLGKDIWATPGSGGSWAGEGAIRMGVHGMSDDLGVWRAWTCIKDVMRLPWESQGRVVVSEADEERRRKAKTLTGPQRLGAERVGSLTWSTQGVLRCLPCSQHRLSWTL